MHPAPSVIIFTTLSGLGFGLFFWLGFGLPEVTGLTAFIFYFFAYALSVGGLLASTFHLGNPQRAMKAFKQWRSSWLSREGILAVLTLLVFGLFAIAAIFYDTRITWLGYLGSALALLTVYTTSMIYAQMKTIPRWNMSLTTPLFLLYAVGGGALLAGQTGIAGVLLLALAALQYVGWQVGDGRFKAEGHTIGTATGLGHLGQVRLLESPHSGSNYLLKEMVHIVGRKHALKLRIIALLGFGLIPGAMLLTLDLRDAALLAPIGVHLVGLFASRWLFFAEAEHVVGLYYDKR